MAVRKRSVSIAGHRTSYSIEDTFQEGLNALARAEGVSAAALIARIDAQRPVGTNLSSALRLHVLQAALDGRLDPPAVEPTGQDRRAATGRHPR